MSRFKKVSVELTFDANFTEPVTLLVEGTYYAGTPDSYFEQGDSPELEIEKLEIVKGNLESIILMNLSMDKITDKFFESLG
jgi:hypothetical protein